MYVTPFDRNKMDDSCEDLVLPSRSLLTETFSATVIPCIIPSGPPVMMTTVPRAQTRAPEESYRSR